MVPRAPGVPPGQEPAFGVLLRLVLGVLPLWRGHRVPLAAAGWGGAFPWDNLAGETRVPAAVPGAAGGEEGLGLAAGGTLR